MIELLIVLVVLCVVMIPVFLIDYFRFSKRLREFNKEISDNPDNLQDPGKRELYQSAINQVRFKRGYFFTAIEERRLVASLKRSIDST